MIIVDFSFLVKHNSKAITLSLYERVESNKSHFVEDDFTGARTIRRMDSSLQCKLIEILFFSLTYLPSRKWFN